MCPDPLFVLKFKRMDWSTPHYSFSDLLVLDPGQYHDIFRIYIDDIFQINTTKPTIVLLQTNLIFQKKILIFLCVKEWNIRHQKRFYMSHAKS